MTQKKMIIRRLKTKTIILSFLISMFILEFFMFMFNKNNIDLMIMFLYGIAFRTEMFMTTPIYKAYKNMKITDEFDVRPVVGKSSSNS